MNERVLDANVSPPIARGWGSRSVGSRSYPSPAGLAGGGPRTMPANVALAEERRSEVVTDDERLLAVAGPPAPAGA
jgi:hypothetical protein